MSRSRTLLSVLVCLTLVISACGGGGDSVEMDLSWSQWRGSDGLGITEGACRDRDRRAGCGTGIDEPSADPSTRTRDEHDTVSQ